MNGLSEVEMATRLVDKTKADNNNSNVSVPKVLLDNDTTRITFHRIKPGQNSGWHRHEHNYVGYHFQASEVLVNLRGNATGSINSQKGKATFYDVGDGFDHDVTVTGDQELVALEIEYKN